MYKQVNKKKQHDKLAINGGEPVRTQPLPWELPGSHYIGEEEIQLVTQVLKAKTPYRYYGLDLQHMVDNLEAEFRTRWKKPYALAVRSGTAALQVALAAMDVGPGDEVLLPGYMWVSCINTIINLGAIPRLVEVDETFCMDPNDLEKKISKRSKVIMLIHMSGSMSHIDKIKTISEKAKIYLLEDCAQAFGASYHGKKVGTFGDMSIFSFQMNKNITSGEGGMIICDDEKLYKRAFAIHDLGYALNEQGQLDPSQKDFQLWGLGCRMSELTGACAFAQLKKLDLILKNMRASKTKIREQLEQIPKLKFRNLLDPKGESGNFLITIYPDADTCQKFTDALRAEGVHGPEGSLLCVTMLEWSVHWYFNIPSSTNKTSISSNGFPWTHPDNQFAKDYSYALGALPFSDELAKRSAILAIPSRMTEQDIKDIVSAFKKVANVLL